MPIHLDKLQIPSQGPLRRDISIRLGAVNLFHGPNEHGKTLVVEFLLRSLFESAAGWRIRDFQLEGSVTVTGLADPTSLFPGSRKKLDSILCTENPGLPPDISRLLIVKGADLSFGNGNNSLISKKILKEYLSGTGTLDAIRASISPTLQSAQLLGGHIAGPNRGEIKAIGQIRSSLDRIDKLSDDLNHQFSISRRWHIQARLEKLQQKQQNLQQARYYRAYQVDDEKRKIRDQLNNLPQDALIDLKSHLDEYEILLNWITNDERETEGLEKNVEHTQWLEHAVRYLESKGRPRNIKPHPFALPAAGAALLSALVLLLLDQPLAVFGALISSSLLTAFHIFQLHNAARSPIDSEQYKKILTEFSTHFPGEKTDLASMKTLLDRLRPGFFRSDQLAGQIESNRQKLADLQHRIQAGFRALGQEIGTHRKWQQMLQSVHDQRNLMMDRVHALDLELKMLDVPPEKYSPIEADHFSREEWENLLTEIASSQQELLLSDERLQSLKQQLCLQTGDIISAEWDDIIQHLKDQRKEISEEHRRAFSSAAAKILVHEVIEELHLQEDKKIQDSLKSADILTPLWNITGKYNQLELEDDEIIVSGPHSRFGLSDLSTGAQDQVLLALRMGIASRLLSGQQAFFIFDDAFQHADWQRRERLMTQIISAARDGWQILYFSMDNHIRQLFNTAGREAFGEMYHYYELAD